MLYTFPPSVTCKFKLLTPFIVTLLYVVLKTSFFKSKVTLKLAVYVELLLPPDLVHGNLDPVIVSVPSVSLPANG